MNYLSFTISCSRETPEQQQRLQYQGLFRMLPVIIEEMMQVVLISMAIKRHFLRHPQKKCRGLRGLDLYDIDSIIASQL